MFHKKISHTKKCSRGNKLNSTLDYLQGTTCYKFVIAIAFDFPLY